MYAPPPAVVPVVPARQGFTQGPLLAACLLGLILFLIAATIVLALIPLYLPTKGSKIVGTTNPSSFVLTPNKQLGNDGTLSPDATSAINSQIATGLGLGSNAIQANGNGVVSSGGSGKRKRRGFNLIRHDRQAANGQKVYLFGSFIRSVCGFCRITLREITITVTFVYGTVTETIIFDVEIFIDQVVSIPATLASTTSTTVSSGGGGGGGSGGGGVNTASGTTTSSGGGSGGGTTTVGTTGNATTVGTATNSTNSTNSTSG